MKPKTNKLIYVVGAFVLLLGAVVIYQVTGKGGFQQFADRGTKIIDGTNPLAANQADADTPTETLEAIRGELIITKEQFDLSQEQNKTMSESQITLNHQLEESNIKLLKLIEDKEKQGAASQRANSTELSSKFSSRISGLENTIDSLRGGLNNMTDKLKETVKGDSLIPIGNQRLFGEGSPDGRLLWVNPPGYDPEATKSANQGGSLLASASSFTPVNAITADTQVMPYMTINNLATLANSTSFTAMLGRVPINGVITDPIPFRVLVGKENLAASGLDLPTELSAMVWEGTAIGNWTLSCVEGDLHTATFIFEDGTIVTRSTVREGTDGISESGGSLVESRGGANQTGSGSRAESRLGYLTDKFGTPCVPGERISNANQFLAKRILLTAGIALGEAAAASATDSVTSGATGTIARTTDNSSDFIIGQTASRTLRDIETHLDERLPDEFDFIYVELGKLVNILVQQQIEIDYNELGRKIRYANNTRVSFQRANLD